MNRKNWSKNLDILATFKEHPDWPNKLIAQHHGVKQHAVEDVIYQARKKGIIPKASNGERISMRSVVHTKITPPSTGPIARKPLSPEHRAKLFAGRDAYNAKRAEASAQSIATEEKERAVEVGVELEQALMSTITPVDSIAPVPKPYVVTPKRKARGANPPKKSPVTIHPLNDTYVSTLPVRVQPYSFGGGLYLNVSKQKGTKLWKYRYSVGKDVNTRREKWAVITIGVFPQMTSDEAAKAADNFLRSSTPVTEKPIPPAPAMDTETITMAEVESGIKRFIRVLLGK